MPDQDSTSDRAPSREYTTALDPLPPTQNLSTLKLANAASTLTGDLGTLPRTFGRYQLVELLGRGGMGAVYLAQDPLLERRIALKMPHAEILRSDHALERFHREARSAARLNHRNICQVYDVGSFEDRHFITMAYVPGKPLSNRVEELLDQPRKVAELVRTLALALGEAHSQGIIHRDLKPANIMMDERDEPVIMDFGLARRADGEAATQTSEGVILGTPAYMPPEQAMGDVGAMGPSCDIYSLGIVLYELLAGRVPFMGPPAAVLVQVIHEQPAPPSAHRPRADPMLEAICLKAVAKLPADRFASMDEFASALDDYLCGRTIQVAPAAPTTPAGRLFDQILREFRTWGWERGLTRAREVVHASKELPESDTSPLLTWLEGDRAVQETILGRFRDETLLPALTAWALAGQTWTSLKQFNLKRGRRELDEAAGVPRALDRVLDGVLAYFRGYICSREGKWEDAVPTLHLALEHLGREHFLTGAVLDCLGRVYAGKCNLQAACEFYQQALACKSHAGDEKGLVLTYEELGRVYIEWEQFDRAEQQLESGLLVAEKFGDECGQAKVLNHLGRVALYRGEHEAARGKQSAARKLYKQAAEYLEFAVAVYQRLGLAIPEGRARKYVAMTRLHDGRVEEAEEHLKRGEELLRESGHPQGQAEISRFLSRVRLAQGRGEEAQLLLRRSLSQYDALSLPIEAARTAFELARALAEGKTPGRLILHALQDALHRAEACRRGELVERIEEALKGVDEEAHGRHIFRRVRGHGAPEDTTSLCSGSSEPVSMLCLELVDFESFCQGMDPEAVMNTLNQVLAELQSVLDRHRTQIMSYLGGGFLALVRESGHAERAVHAAIDLLQTMSEFNRPRQILGLPLLPARIGIASGFVFLGNIGTYRHLDFAAVGPPVTLAASLMRRATATGTCISQDTRDQIGERFLFSPQSPRTVDIAGIGTRQVWEIVGRAAPSSVHPRR